MGQTLRDPHYSLFRACGICLPQAAVDLDTLIEKYRQQLLDSDFRAGCPVVAVAVEAGFERDGERERTASVTERAAAAFDRWTDLIAQRFITDGLPADRATELAVLATSAIEGAILLARVRRDLTPLDVVHRQLRSVFPGVEDLRKDPGDDR